jgi:hypothetical protein
VASAARLLWADDPIGTIVCSSVLEPVDQPETVASEILRGAFGLIKSSCIYHLGEPK